MGNRLKFLNSLVAVLSTTILILSCSTPSRLKSRSPAVEVQARVFSKPQIELRKFWSKTFSYLTMEGSDPTQVDVKQSLAANNRLASKNLALQTTNGSFSDLQYLNQVPTEVWDPAEHFKRLHLMSQLYWVKGQNLYQNKAVLNAIEKGLSYGLNFYSPTVCPFPVSGDLSLAGACGNWWIWEIGVPLDLAPTLFLMQSVLDPGVFQQALGALTAHIGDKPTMTGENLLWLSYSHMFLALIERDQNRLELVRDTLNGLCQVTNSDGIRSDQSFSQHGKIVRHGDTSEYLGQLQTGGYGGNFGDDISIYFLLSADTSFQLNDVATSTCLNYVANGIRWATFGSYFDPSVIGRGVTVPATNAGIAIRAMLRLSVIKSPLQKDFQSSALQMLKSWSGPLQLEISPLAQAVKRSGVIPSWPSGLKIYPDSDYVTFRRPNFFISMSSFFQVGQKSNFC